MICQFSQCLLEGAIQMLEELVESIDLGSGSDSKRSQTIIRILIGLTGTILAAVGAIKSLVDGVFGAGVEFRMDGATRVCLLACFCLLNITLYRTWRWPGRGFWVSLAGLFVVRIVFGA